MATIELDPGALDPTRLPIVGLDAARSGADVVQLAALASRCQACDLWERATQTVFGEGPPNASIVLIGEQPGDQEDRAGHPFVGPAGRLLNEALALAGIDREKTFVTNVVKHFKWKPVPGSKRRLHEKPNAVQVRACRPWLESELQLVGPKAVVLMGATAAQSVLGPGIRLSDTAGRLVDSDVAQRVVATIHPSAVLRARGGDARDHLLERLVGDLHLVADVAASEAVCAFPVDSRGPRADQPPDRRSCPGALVPLPATAHIRFSPWATPPAAASVSRPFSTRSN